ncbi:hypothetical protein MMYC01_201913 [Madurella mycetomatis]|uniref:Uncharacterized protein n=1 Tax=Madurella mycetomatis TaxID=100816 RepID=A0A175W1F4_9PEZI|nr:hypothetical protein MMYC01_207048 [Madurella mycetomatis]KXX81302.1 hypothetical protein MMYC01_201913 [Madurella mycetomatis]
MSFPIAIPTRRNQTSTTGSDTSPLHAKWGQSSSKTQPIPCAGRPLSQTDSGYGTGSDTSFVSLSAKAKGILPKEDEAQNTIKSVPLPGREELQIFKTEIDQVFNLRFQEIAPKIQHQLLNSLQKGTSFFQKSKARPKKQLTTSIRLMMVGKTIDAAKPSIVIFLPGEGASRLESVLEQTVLRQLYDPEDGITPSFEVVVVGQAPRKRFCQDVHVTWDTSWTGEREQPTFCGVRLCLQTPEGMSAMATLGGVVKLTYRTGDFKLVGMTAGHMLEDLLDPEADSEPIYPAGNQVGEVTSPRTIGTVLHPRLDGNLLSEDLDELIPTCDWALFEIDPAVKIKPNLLHQVDAATAHSRRLAHSGIMTSRTMITAPPASYPTIEPIEVAVLSGSSCFGGTMLGVLSHIPGGIMLSPGKGFVDAYLLCLDEGQELQDGDSGSWVVNPISKEVYGHVVATDMTGDAYVIPLHRSFEEMRETLGVESVDLPRIADLLDAALRASAAHDLGSYNSDKRAMMIGGWPQERRASEVFLMCEGWRLRDLKRTTGYDDGDSGYGSMGSPFGRTPFDIAAEDEERPVETIS